MELLKSERYSKLCYCLQYPFKWFLEMDTGKKLMELLKSERYSKLCYCLQYPFKWFLEMPSASSLV